MSILYGTIAYILLAVPLAVAIGDALKANRRRYPPIRQGRRI